MRRDKEGESIGDGIWSPSAMKKDPKPLNFFFPSCNFSLVPAKSIVTIRAKPTEGFGIMEDADPRTHYANKSKKTSFPGLPEMERLHIKILHAGNLSEKIPLENKSFPGRSHPVTRLNWKKHHLRTPSLTPSFPTSRSPP